MDIDEVFKEIGEFGSQQRWLFTILALPGAISSFHMVHTAIIGANPHHFYCHHGNNITVDKCSTSSSNTSCDHYSYSNEHGFTSIVTEWDLVCKNSYKVGLVQSMFMAGVLVGAVLFGSLSDNIGRRRVALMTMFGLSFFTTASTFAYDYKTYLAFRFTAGVFNGGIILVSFVMACEIVGASKRSLVGMMIQSVFSFGLMIFAGLGSIIRSWQILSLFLSFPGFLVLSLLWFVPESPRWLLSKGKIKEAETILESIAMKNSGSTQVKPIELRPIKASSNSKSDTRQEVTYGLSDLICHPSLRWRTLIQIYAWFVNSAVYYGLTMSAGNLGSNLYISLFLSALVEIPAYLSAFFILGLLGRRKTFSGIMLVGGTSCLSIMLMPPAHTRIITSLALLGKLAISASFATVYIYSAELYPTVIRNNALGVCSMAARVGGIVAPAITPLSNVSPVLPFLIYGCLAFSAGLFSLLLPETAGKPMPETIDDLEIEVQVNDDVQLSDDKLKLLEDCIEQCKMEDKLVL